MSKAKDPQAEAEKIATDRDRFAHHLDAYESAVDFVSDAKSALHNVIESARQDGFTTEDMKFGLSLRKQKEREARAKIRRRLYIAKLLGNELGDQLDLFQEPTPKPKSKEVKITAEMIKDTSEHLAMKTLGSSGFVPFTSEELEEQQRLADEIGKH